MFKMISFKFSWFFNKKHFCFWWLAMGFFYQESFCGCDDNLVLIIVKTEETFPQDTKKSTHENCSAGIEPCHAPHSPYLTCLSLKTHYIARHKFWVLRLVCIFCCWRPLPNLWDHAELWEHNVGSSLARCNNLFAEVAVLRRNLLPLGQKYYVAFIC